MMGGGKLDPIICEIVFENYDAIISDAEEYLRPATTAYNALAAEYVEFSAKYKKAT